MTHFTCMKRWWDEAILSVKLNDLFSFTSKVKMSLHFVWGSVHTTPVKFENTALFLRLGLPSTLIRQGNIAFRKRSSNRRNLKTTALRLTVDGKHFWKRWRHDNYVISLSEFTSNTDSKWPVIVGFLNFPISENFWCYFGVRTPISNLPGVMWKGS